MARIFTVRTLHIVMHVGILASQRQSVFTSALRYKNWKKAKFRDGGFALHVKGEVHLNAMIAWKEFERREKAKQKNIVSSYRKITPMQKV